MLADCKCSGRLSGPVPTAGLMQETAPAQPSFYRRQLPTPPAIDFASEEGKAIFAEALVSGGLAGFFPLIAQFQTQAEPAYCGLASLSVALNALSIDPGRTWKGPWRWYDEAQLDCCEPLEKIRAEGIVFSKLVCLARCAGAGVKSVLASGGSERVFRDDVRRAANTGEGHVIAGYSRRAFRQTGDGHFSPIGGYHAARDLVLILDVARFKYPPHWVPLPLLWQAMQQVDKVTGRSRGYVMLTPRAQPSAALFSLARPDSKWRHVAEYASAGVSEVLRHADVSTAEQALGALLGELPEDVTHLLTWMRAALPAGEDAAAPPREGQAVQAVKELVLRQLRSLPIFGLMSSWVARQTEQKTDTRSQALRPTAQTNGKDEGAEAGHINRKQTDDVTAKTPIEIRGVFGVEKRVVTASATALERTSGSERPAKRARVEASGEPKSNKAGGRDVQHAEKEPETELERKAEPGETDAEISISDLPEKERFELRSSIESREHALRAAGEDSQAGIISASDAPTRVDLLTLLLLVCPSEVWHAAKDAAVREELQSLTNTCCLDSPLHGEVLHLREQYEALRTEACEGSAAER